MITMNEGILQQIGRQFTQRGTLRLEDMSFIPAPDAQEAAPQPHELTIGGRRPRPLPLPVVLGNVDRLGVHFDLYYDYVLLRRQAVSR